jgi:hypothetical protein
MESAFPPKSELLLADMLSRSSATERCEYDLRVKALFTMRAVLAKT